MNIHDDVLARLLDLNQRRYAEEVAAGLHAEKCHQGVGIQEEEEDAAASGPAAFQRCVAAGLKRRHKESMT